MGKACHYHNIKEHHNKGNVQFNGRRLHATGAGNAFIEGYQCSIKQGRHDRRKKALKIHTTCNNTAANADKSDKDNPGCRQLYTAEFFTEKKRCGQKEQHGSYVIN